MRLGTQITINGPRLPARRSMAASSANRPGDETKFSPRISSHSCARWHLAEFLPQKITIITPRVHVYRTIEYLQCAVETKRLHVASQSLLSLPSSGRHVAFVCDSALFPRCISVSVRFFFLVNYRHLTAFCIDASNRKGKRLIYENFIHCFSIGRARSASAEEEEEGKGRNNCTNRKTQRHV